MLVNKSTAKSALEFQGEFFPPRTTAMGMAASCSRSIWHTLAWAFPHEILRLSRDLSSPSLHQGRYMLQRPGRLIAVGMENIEWILSVKSLPYVLHAEEPSYISSCFYWMGEVYQWIVHPVPTLGFSSLPLLPQSPQ